MAKFTNEVFEKNSILLLIGTLIVVSIGGIVEIAPLFLIKNTIEEVEGMRPYTPLELAGRHIYLREGCYTCHSQQIRALRAEVERYGHYSLAAESMFDHPFQWGSKRTGPDLARVGGKYSDEWHQIHMTDPRAVVPESIMPGYPFLSDAEVSADLIAPLVETHAAVGVPYTEAMLKNATVDLLAQADPLGDPSGLEERYQNVIVRDFDGDPARVTEMDALIAYLQMLGTLVDFDLYNSNAEENLR